MRTGSWRSRLLACGALVVAASVGVTVPANAAVTQCMTESYSDGAKIVPGSNGGQKTRGITLDKAPTTKKDVVWKGTDFECNEERTCRYTWEKSKTTTTGWSVGGGVDAGNASSPSKKWYNLVIPLTAGYGQTVEIKTSFTFSVDMKSGDIAAPMQIAIRRTHTGNFSGGWVRTNRGCRGGMTYEWKGNVSFGKWTKDVFERELVKYSINGVY